jgi:hypothetical protein
VENIITVYENGASHHGWFLQAGAFPQGFTKIRRADHSSCHEANYERIPSWLNPQSLSFKATRWMTSPTGTP